MKHNLQLLLVMLLSIGFSGMATAGEFVVLQHDKSFVLQDKQVEKLNIKVGDSIRFQNDDPFFHNIFSLSDHKTFDLGSYPKGEFKAVKFDKAGKVEIECAIHPQMFMEVTIQ
jgi:plastocyanin